MGRVSDVEETGEEGRQGEWVGGCRGEGVLETPWHSVRTTGMVPLQMGTQVGSGQAEVGGGVGGAGEGERWM